MQIGHKGGGKHWTAAEVAAREAAAESMKRRDAKKIEPPDWLSSAAKKLWSKKLKELEGVDLLDALDAESMAAYCDAVVSCADLARKKNPSIDDHKAKQAYMRIIAQFADKLGFTPAARVRLIKKRAEEKRDAFGADFD